MTRHDDEKLEQVMTEALRGLPARRAPTTLESRVLGELQRRALLAWWRRSFAYWPGAARAAFVFLNVGLVVGTFLSGFSNVVGGRSFSDFAAMVTTSMRPFLSVLSSVVGLTPILLHSIPSVWLYFGAAVGVLLYGTVFGLGAAAYRTLYLRPSMAGDRL